MDMFLTKILITYFVCVIGITTGVPLKDSYYQSASLRNKRSPANDYSLFGFKPFSFSVPNPITSAQNTLNSFGNPLKPAAASRNENNKMQIKTQGDKIPSRQSVSHLPSVSVSNENADKITETTPSNIFTTSKTTIQNTKPIKNNNNVNENEVTELYTVDNVKEKDTSSNNNNSVNMMEIDQTIVDAIFRERTTTEDNTDYTTATGDYESTTTDELLRIPAAAVATLLG